MERIDGYLCIDDCDKVIADKDKHHYWVMIDGIEYYFKPIECPYHELIAYYAALSLGIEACYCDLAILNDERGIISKSLRNDKVKLIPGDVLLGDYLSNSIDIIRNMGLPKGYIEVIEDSNIKDYDSYFYAEHINSLEIIWQALEYRYGNKIDIKEIMNQFVLMYLFTIIFHDMDKHPGNWMLMESKDKIRLAPLFDNERIFNDYWCGVNLTTNFNDPGEDIGFSVCEFLKISSSEYYELFINMYDKIINEFDSILGMIEKQIGRKIPTLEKKYVISMLNKNILIIDKALKSSFYRKSR